MNKIYSLVYYELSFPSNQDNGIGLQWIYGWSVMFKYTQFIGAVKIKFHNLD